MHHITCQEFVLEAEVDTKCLNADVLHAGKDDNRDYPEQVAIRPYEKQDCCLDVNRQAAYPYLLEDSSMTSLRFSLMEISIELNFCLTCFRGRLEWNKVKLLRSLWT